MYHELIHTLPTATCLCIPDIRMLGALVALLLLHQIAWCHSSGHKAQQNTHNNSVAGRFCHLMAQHQGDGLHGETSPGKFITAETVDKLETKSDLNFTMNFTMVRIC